MGHLLDTELLNWLEGGGRVVTASERTARALAAEYHRTRRARGESAWTSPRIEPWTQFLASCWHALSSDGRMVLAPLQEQALWATVAGAEAELATTLEPSRQRLGRLAMEAHSLLANYAPRALDPRTREGWERDQAAFSRWLAAFDSECRQQQLLSPARLPLEMLALLDAVPLALREPLLVAGFDRLLPVQRQLFDAWGSWQELPLPELQAELRFYAASDESAELTACARWISRQLERNPRARLLVIAQNQSQLRGQMERIFLEQAGISGAESFEFSLGVSLAKTALVRSARQLLAWLTNAIDEHALDILLASGHATASDDEQAALLRRMKRLRERGRQRELWTLDAFLNEHSDSSVPPPWRERMQAAQALLAERSASAQSPLAWAELVPQLLAAAAWPGARPLTSAEYQLHRRLQEALDSAASLGSITRRNSWNGFLAVLDNILMETLYTSESQNAPVLIAGPAETAGLTADAIWFLGATEDGWPAIGTTHPFLPISLQRDARMPHAHPRMDWELAEAMTHRLAASADELVFSYARQSSGVETNPSRLALRVAGPPEPLPAELLAPPQPAPRTITVQDRCRIPYPATGASGGSELITNQSACPFKAFAAARLGARSWDAAEPGLTAAQRGTLLHAVLHAVWSGPPRGIRSQAELQALPDRTAFVQEHVERVFQDHLPTNAREQMPRRYIALEAERLTALIVEWLNFEAERMAFTVDATELKTTATLAGLSLNLRLDRVDRLNDDTLLIVDYKTGDVKTKAWEIPRPEDPQLPLYAEMMKEAKAAGAITSFDLNYRAKLWNIQGGEAKAVETLGKIVENVDVLVGNEEDLQKGLGIEGQDVHSTSKLDPSAFFAMIEKVVKKQPNVKVVATTLREVHSTNHHSWSAVAWMNGQNYVAPTAELDVVDRVGGGDGFAAGFIYGLLTGEEPEEAVKLGWAHGALLTTFPGDTTMATVDQVRALAQGGSARIQR